MNYCPSCGSSLMSIRYQTLPLAQVHVFLEVEFSENCLESYGPELSTVIFNWMEHHDPGIFDRCRPEIDNNFKNQNSAEQFLFFYRLDKIIRLYQYWHARNSWRDPIVAIPSNPTHYFAHPGKDRLLVMKSLNVAHYRFLVIDREYIKEENLETIKTHWGAYSNNLSISTPVSQTERRSILNKDNTELILKYQQVKLWLKSKLPFMDFIKLQPRDLLIRQMVK